MRRFGLIPNPEYLQRLADRIPSDNVALPGILAWGLTGPRED